MTNHIENATTGTSKGDAELRELHRNEDHEYLPMNVFVDSATMKTHFQCLSIHARWTGIHPAA